MIILTPGLILLLDIIFGLLALFAGRRLFWLFAAIVGFSIGMNLGARFGAGENPTLQLIVALLAGIAGALLGWFLPRVAAAVVGFVAGYLLAGILLNAILPNADELITLIVAIAGGLVGAGIAWALLDVGLVVVSALWGAGILVNRAQQIFGDAPGLAGLFGTTWELIIVLALAVIGMIVQFGTLRMMGRPVAYRRAYREPYP
jgi:hypothetical protein